MWDQARGLAEEEFKDVEVKDHACRDPRNCIGLFCLIRVPSLLMIFQSKGAWTP